MLNCSCGNRHCPECQGDKTLDWVDRQEEKCLPVENFLLTFTVPEELRSLIYKHKKEVYKIMFEKSSEVIKEMMENPKNLGVDHVGFTSILHTWGNQLQYHPHIHVLLPGGGVDKTGQWKSLRPGFGLPVRAASKLWLGKLLSALERLVGRESLPSKISSKNFIVHCKAAGTGKETIRYLSRYVFRVAIHNSRILKLERGKVTFSYKDKKLGGIKMMTLEVSEFIRRFLMHVLPSGFMKVRHYGFYHSNSNIDKDILKIRILQFSEELAKYLRSTLLSSLKCDPVKKQSPKCTRCGSDLKMIEVARIEKTYQNTG
jgi:hypothetical protein